jgi:glycogen debranching enzyme
VGVTTAPLTDVVCVRGDSFAVSGPEGDISPGGTHGFFARDGRVLDELRLTVEGRVHLPLSGGALAPDRAEFHSCLASSADREVDPTVRLVRRRFVAGGLHESVEVTNAGGEPERLVLAFTVGTDLAYIFDVKHGRHQERVAPREGAEGIVFTRDGAAERAAVRVGHDEVAAVVLDGERAILRVPVEVPAGGTARVCLEVSGHDVYGALPAPSDERGGSPGPGPVPSPPPSEPWATVRTSDHRFTLLVERSQHDLAGLLQADPDAPEDRFAAAGSPWFLTLFGRDSLWAALMALPFAPELARGTLRVLARRQGTVVDRDREEEPGKILHEVRRGALTHRGDLPPTYYGSVDSTPLFLILAEEAWRWGLPSADLEALMPAVERALAWMRDHGDADGDGFLEYVRHGDRGLANQGWKDSGDGIRFADGRIAQAPLALAEVQGYAYAAARAGAALLDATGRPGGATWRDWADGLAARFRSAFWAEDAAGPFPGVALDRDKRLVDSVASNMGHLLFTGILDTGETRLVADRLVADDMASGWGLRTLSASSGGYNPLAYHCGTVWPHDTAIAAWGLARNGHGAEAKALLESLLRAAPWFDYRLPELYAGLGTSEASRPVPYPTACRPQAWAAAGALLLVRTALGLHADVPAGRLRLAPLAPMPLDRLDVLHLPLAGGHLDVRFRGGRIEVDLRELTLDVIVTPTPVAGPPAA